VYILLFVRLFLLYHQSIRITLIFSEAFRSLRATVSTIRSYVFCSFFWKVGPLLPQHPTSRVCNLHRVRLPVRWVGRRKALSFTRSSNTISYTCVLDGYRTSDPKFRTLRERTLLKNMRFLWSLFDAEGILFQLVGLDSLSIYCTESNKEYPIFWGLIWRTYHISMRNSRDIANIGLHEQLSK
jgi:hypothetical protein